MTSLLLKPQCCCEEEVNDCGTFRICLDAVGDNDFDGDVEIAISGAANQNCANCVNLNDTWLFPGPHTVTVIDLGGGNQSCAMSDVLVTGVICGAHNIELVWSVSYNEASETLTITARAQYDAGFRGWLFRRIEVGAAAHAVLGELCAGTAVTIPFDSENDPLPLFGFCVLDAATVTMQLVFP